MVKKRNLFGDKNKKTYLCIMQKLEKRQNMP